MATDGNVGAHPSTAHCARYAQPHPVHGIDVILNNDANYQNVFPRDMEKMVKDIQTQLWVQKG